MEYLAVDFGTANSLSAELGLDKVLRFVHLENDSELLPTAIFVPRIDGGKFEPSEGDIQARFKQNWFREESRRGQIDQEIESRFKGFLLNNGPSKPDTPKRGDYLSERSFENALAQHSAALLQYEKARRFFIDGEAAAYLSKIRVELSRFATKEEVLKRSEIEVRREFAERSYEVNFHQTFFSVLKEPGHPPPIFGLAALEQYEMSNLGGFLLRSPKAFLGSSLHPDVIELFVVAISKILSHIKQKAERQLDKEFAGVVIGRPVTFLGDSDGSGNDSAIRIVRAAAVRAGFGEVRFVYEPHAAGLAIANTISQSEDAALLIDLGGGTTDCSYLKPGGGDRRSLSIIASTGRRIGGADFDETLAWHLFSEHLGRGSMLRDGKLMPSSVINDLLATRDVNKQVRFRKSYDDILRFLSSSDEQIRINRLFETLLSQYQHRLISAAEGIKRALSNDKSATVELDFYSDPVSIHCEQRLYLEYVARELMAIKGVINECLQKAQHGSRPLNVFLTGGMSISPSVLSVIQLSLPGGSKFSRIDPFRSVGAGLAVVARALSDAGAISQEPDSVRGVPVMN